MKSKVSMILAAMVFAAAFAGSAANAVEPNAQVKALLDSYRKDAGVQAFSADDGRKFFNSKHSTKNEERSCTTCHTTDPRQPGKTVVGKVIDPMAPSVNKERFTDPKKMEKWFKRNCTWVLDRECTPKEKGDFIIYMLSIR